MPEPVGWPFVRRDDISVGRLKEAAAIVSEMAADIDRPLPDREALSIWYLSCVANQTEKLHLAADVCAELIAKHPCNIYVLPWALRLI